MQCLILSIYIIWKIGNAAVFTEAGAESLEDQKFEGRWFLNAKLYGSQPRIKEKINYTQKLKANLTKPKL